MNLNLLVLANPNVSWLKSLGRLDPDIRCTVADQEEDVRAAASKTDVILNAEFTSRLLDVALPLATNLRWIHSLWTGVENIMSPIVLTNPAPLTNGRGVFRVSLAEWAIAAMLHFSYGIRRMISQQEAGIWKPFTTAQIHGRTLGIVGYGEIGRATAERARALGMRIIALRRRPELFAGDSVIDQAFDRAHINDLIAESDYVLAAAPLTPQTIGLIGAEQIASMKTTAVIINVGRGAAIDEPALIDALYHHRISGAALDVFAEEPLPCNHPFYKMENVLLSPHTADHVQNFIHLAVECFLDNMRRFQAEEPLQNVVDKQAGY